MPALVLDDPAEQVSQHRMAGLANQRAVPGQRGQLVDRADREVDRGEVLHQPRSRHRRQNAHAVLETEVRAHVRDAILRVELDTVEVQQLADVLAVPQLLVVPAGEERGEDGVHACACDEQVGQVEGDMVFDVHHVVQAEEIALR